MPVPPSERGISPQDDYDPARRKFLKNMGIVLGIGTTFPALLACRTPGTGVDQVSNSGTVRTESSGQTTIQLGRESIPIDKIRTPETPEDYFRVPHEYPKIPPKHPRLPEGVGVNIDEGYNPGLRNGGSLRGFLIAKNRDSNGGFLFAVEVPREKEPRDMIHSGDNFTIIEGRPINSYGQMLRPKRGSLMNVTVWLKVMSEAERSRNGYPMSAWVRWGRYMPEGKYDSGSAGYGEEAFFKFSRLGDYVEANINYTIGDNADTGLRNLGVGYEQGRARLQELHDRNLNTTKKLAGDFGKKISLSDQLEGRRYVFYSSWLDFNLIEI